MRNRIKGLAPDPLRCPRCRLHTDLCACDVLRPMAVATELVVVAHRYEVRKPTSTGRLAVLCLQGARLCRRGLHGAQDDPVTWGPGRTPLLLFPCPGAIPLDAWRAAQPTSPPPVALIVPDGTWRQAKRVRRRVPGLAAITAVTVPGAHADGVRLRQPTAPNRLATLEAIARAFGILEGPAAEAHLMHAFRTVVERALWSNGRLSSAEITTSIPKGARQDGPLSRGPASLRDEPPPTLATP
ncbi:MAG: DTW domain-containing protein [Deltaproteobacteria bacterium]|nr:DTW domain-containing protein [Deltaproteobacteria bacterium]